MRATVQARGFRRERYCEPTWRHVKRRAAPVVFGSVTGGGQAKIRQLNSLASVGDKNVLWLKVPVINPKVVAVLYSIKDLEEHALGKLVLTNILSTLSDVEKKITFRAVLQ